MEKFLHPVELKNVSYERNKFRFQKKLKGLTFFTAASMLMFFSFTASASNEDIRKEELTITKQMSDYTLITQDTSTAVFSSKTSLVLNEESPLVKYYVADISNLGFANTLEGNIFFNRITDNLLSYKIDYKTNKVVINIRLEYANKAWGVADWNKYINSKLNP